MIVTSHAVFRDTYCRPLTGRWAYDTTDPHAISLTLNNVEWVFARDLLATALRLRCRLVGDGDIELHAGLPGPRLWMTLRPPGGALRVSCPLPAVESFYAATVQTCPPCYGTGCEDPFCAQCAHTRAALDEALVGILEDAL